MIARKTVSAIELCVRLASQRDGRYASTQDLSQSLGLSISHIETLLKTLRTHHIVDSSKGPGGGYMFNGDPSCITIWDIASLFEETSHTRPEDAASSHASYELGLEQLVVATLGTFTLADFTVEPVDQPRGDAHAMGRFKLKPLDLPYIPKAPNSVFQLGAMV